MNNTGNPSITDATQPPDDPGPPATADDNPPSGKWGKKIEEAKRIISSGELGTMTSPTKRLVYYYLDLPKKGYPLIPKRVLFREYGVKPQHFYDKDKKVKNGFPYEHNTKCPILNENEGKELLEYIRGNAEMRSCVTIPEIVTKATEIVARRKLIYHFGEELNKDTVKDWCARHGICFTAAMTEYKALSLSDRESIQKMFDNIHMLMDRYNYSPTLILNMDESWVATEKKVSSHVVAHPPDLPPISHAPADGVHITLIGCISKNGEVVTPTYIVPSALKSNSLRQKFHLEGLTYAVNKSGFMTGELFAWWIRAVLVPWVNEKRTSPLQHALLICDAHSSRMNENARAALKENLIDMVVLPAHVTSKFQPLDVGVYSSYKNKYRELVKKVKGGVYGSLYVSMSAFHVATMPMNIFNAWDASQLFSANYKDVIESYLPRAPGVKENNKSNYVVESTPIVEV